jgi:hypothetical protein
MLDFVAPERAGRGRATLVGWHGSMKPEGRRRTMGGRIALRSRLAVAPSNGLDADRRSMLTISPSASRPLGPLGICSLSFNRLEQVIDALAVGDIVAPVKRP